MNDENLRIIVKLQQGECVLCSVCGLPLALVGLRASPSFAECPKGHRVFYVLANDIPPEMADIDRYSVWIEPLHEATFIQLNTITRFLNPKPTNLVETKRMFSDGDRHFLVGNLSRGMAGNVEKELKAVGICSSVGIEPKK